MKTCWLGLSTLDSTHLRSIHLAVAPFLKYPAIAIRIGEVGEAGIVSARGIEPGCETSVPGVNGYLVPNLTDFNPTFD